MAVANTEHRFVPFAQEGPPEQQEPLAGDQSATGSVLLEGGDYEYERPGEDDGWLLLDTDPASDFYGEVVHGDPQTAGFWVFTSADGDIAFYFDARSHYCGKATLTDPEGPTWEWTPAPNYGDHDTPDPPSGSWG